MPPSYSEPLSVSSYHLLNLRDEEAEDNVAGLLDLSVEELNNLNNMDPNSPEWRESWLVWNWRYTIVVANDLIVPVPLAYDPALLRLQVYLGLGELYSVPCPFWSDPEAYLAVAAKIASIWKGPCGGSVRHKFGSIWKRSGGSSDHYKQILARTAEVKRFLIKHPDQQVYLDGMDRDSLPLRFGL